MDTDSVNYLANGFQYFVTNNQLQTHYFLQASMMSDAGSYRSDNEDTLHRTVTPARADTVSFTNV